MPMSDPSTLIAQLGSDELRRTCGDDAGFVCTELLDLTGSRLLAAAGDTVLGIIVVVVVAWLANRLAKRVARRFVLSVTGEGLRRSMSWVRDRTPDGLLATGPANLRARTRARTIGVVLESVAGVAIWTTAALMVLAELDVNLGPLIAGAGIVGVALGFGAQSLVKDFLTGTFMLLEDQFGVGDVIDCGEATGVVEGVSLRTTRLRDVEGTVWHVPNGQIARIANLSQEWSRALLDVGVAYDTDLEAAKLLVKAVADEVWRDPSFATSIIDEPEMWGVEAFGPDGVVLRLVVRTRPADQWLVLRELRQRIKAAFDEAGVEIPFPQRTVWVRPPPPPRSS